MQDVSLHGTRSATMASQLNLPLPSKLNLTTSNLAIAWRKFHAQWSNYEVATDLATASDKRRVAVFLACAGADAQDLFTTFNLSDVERDNLDTVIDKFQQHCVGIANVTYERYLFNKRSQDDTESFDTFVSDLRRLVNTCRPWAVPQNCDLSCALFEGNFSL